MKAVIEISLGLPSLSRIEQLVALAAHDAAELFPNQIAAIEALAQEAHAKWVGYASGNEALPDGSKVRPWSGAYLRSIKLESLSRLEYVLRSDASIAPHAHALEEGSPSWDMRIALRTSPKVRISSKGNRYLIIPFRHGTPTALVVGAYPGRQMSKPVYKAAKRLAPSRITGSYTEWGGVKRNTYDWGGRLTFGELKNLGANDLEASRMAGMVRMEASVGNAPRSTYLTFRTLSENSEEGTWIMPERPGKHIARAVLDWVNGAKDALLQQAKALDIEHIRALSDPNPVPS